MVNVVNIVGGCEGERLRHTVSYYVLTERYIYMSNLGHFEVLTVRHPDLPGKCTKFTKCTGGSLGPRRPPDCTGVLRRRGREARGWPHCAKSQIHRGQNMLRYANFRNAIGESE
jgi:hypothetical protein